LFIHVGGNGGFTTLTNKCYAKGELKNKIPFADSRPSFKRASEDSKSFSSERIAVGKTDSTQVFEATNKSTQVIMIMSKSTYLKMTKDNNVRSLFRLVVRAMFGFQTVISSISMV
jgi:hypothetical protein